MAQQTSWTNAVNPLDVNDDGFVSPVDALVIINELNNPTISHSPLPVPATPLAYYDVNGDTFLSPIDALVVINDLNASAAPLVASSTALSAVRDDANTGDVITDATLAPIVQQAMNYWSASGLSRTHIGQLNSAVVTVADLPDAQLGEASGNRVVIDTNAAGLGWFVDQTPKRSEEFQWTGAILDALANSQAAGRMDLLSTVVHELGHMVGLSDLAPSFANVGQVMNSELNLGERRLSDMTSHDSFENRLSRWGCVSLTEVSSELAESTSWSNNLEEARHHSLGHRLAQRGELTVVVEDDLGQAIPTRDSWLAGLSHQEDGEDSIIERWELSLVG